MDTRIAVISLWAEDVQTVASFYRDVVGLRPALHHGERPHFDVSGVHLTIVRGRLAPPPHSTPTRFPLVAFAVADLDAAVERLRAHQVAMPWGIEASADSRWVLFYDPAGNLVELVSFKPGEPAA